MKEHVYKHRVNNVDELKHCLPDVWRGLQQNVIDLAVHVNEWRKWLCMRNIHSGKPSRYVTATEVDSAF